jgi:hypothetical protein
MNTEAFEDSAELVPVTSYVPAVVNPMDMEPGAFSAGLERRKANRASLMDWIRQALVEGTDYGSIPVKGRASKPSLWKPGAEKICGMLNVTVTFPTLGQYEAAALAGTKLESIIIRCELVSPGGAVAAAGVGSRSVVQDHGDLNKAMKMACKSAHIDATLRMGGLSEVFTQDLEDMPARTTPGIKASDIRKAVERSSHYVYTEWLEQAKAHMVDMMQNNAQQWFAYACSKSWIHNELETLHDIPASALLADCNPNLPLGENKAIARTAWDILKRDMLKFTIDNTTEESRPEPTDPGDAVEDQSWRTMPVPFGKDAGKPIGEMNKEKLFGWWMNWLPKPTTPNGTVKQPGTMRMEEAFREALNAAGKHYQFKAPEGQISAAEAYQPALPGS